MRLLPEKLSVKRRLIAGVVAISLVGLLIACTTFCLVEFFGFRASLQRDVTVLADVVGYGASASITFTDRPEANRTLKSLELQPHIVAGGLYTTNGVLFATYARKGSASVCPPAPGEEAWFSGRSFHVFRKIFFENEFVGTIYLESDLHALKERILAYFGISCGILAGMVILTVAMARRFQQTFTAPVFDLVTTAREIALRKDYSLRARKHRADELGALADEFNGMLQQILLRDGELQSARADLERRVDERTADLQAQIAERQRTEERLRKEEEFVRNVLDLAPSCIFVKDAAGRFILVNRGTADLFQRRPEEMIGQTDESFGVRPVQAGQFTERHEHVLKTGEDTTLSQQGVIDPSGRLHWMYTMKRRLQGRGGEAQVLTVATDMTERHEAELQMKRAKEAAEMANRSKSEFLANMSHEIRTPMNGIIGMANLLLDTRLENEQREFARTIASSSEALLTILSDILDISKIEAGKLEFECIPFDLHEAVKATIDLLAPRAHEKRLALNYTIDPSVAAAVRGDPTRLRQVLLNLIGNAIKFTMAGDVAVRVTRVSSGEGGHRLRFEIQDTGIGIAAEVQTRLFQPFSQADGSTTRKFGGTGLGLFISRQLVERMHGEIGILQSGPSGTTFWFTVLLKASADAAASPVVEPPAQPPAPRKARILIAEDNVVNQKLALRMVQKLGHDAAVVGNGLSALESLRGEAFDLVLMDCQMPEMDGYEATRRLRSETRTARLPIIAVTANAMQGDREKCLEAGMDDYITKPVKLDVLERVLGRYLQ